MAAIGFDPPNEEFSVVKEEDCVPDHKEVPFALDITRVISTEPPPNGGWVAWSQVLGGHIVAFFTWGFITSFVS